ncbi:MAG: hypothetical protein ACK56F_01205, partial [bacterium]
MATNAQARLPPSSFQRQQLPSPMPATKEHRARRAERNLRCWLAFHSTPTGLEPASEAFTLFMRNSRARDSQSRQRCHSLCA